MIFGIAEYISVMTRNLTLYPGDVIWMGTDDPTLDMVAGDTVEIAIEGIGALRNPVVSSETNKRKLPANAGTQCLCLHVTGFPLSRE